MIDRKIVQVAMNDYKILALAEDGTLWRSALDGKWNAVWEQLPPLPMARVPGIDAPAGHRGSPQGNDR